MIAVLDAKSGKHLEVLGPGASPLVHAGRAEWGGEYVVATVGAHRQATRIHIHTERGLGHDWYSPVHRVLIARLQPAAASKDGRLPVGRLRCASAARPVVTGGHGLVS